MSKLTETYSKAANAKNRASTAVANFTRDFFPYLILVFNIIITVCSRLFNAWVENPFTTDFFISLATNLLTTMFCYACFIRYGEDNEILAIPNYDDTITVWSNMSGEVRTKLAGHFTEYCRKQVDAEREDKRHCIISNHTMIAIAEYMDKYMKLSKAEILQLVEEGKLTKEDGKWICRANKTHYVRPINPMLILCGVHAANANDVGRDGVRYSTMSMAARPVAMFLLTAGITMFKGSWIGVDDASAIFDMLYSILMIVISSILGYSSGAKSARKEFDKVKGRIYFLEKFLNTASGQS